MIRIRSFTVGPFQENSYLVTCGESGEAIFVDPGDEADLLIGAARKEGAKIRAIYNTHAHIDHVGAVEAVKREFDVPFFLHRADQFWLDHLGEQAAMFGLQPPPTPAVDRYFQDGERFKVGALEFEILHTPGHAPGHVAFFERGERVVFSGDLVILGGVGRTDLPGGDPGALMASIRDRLLPLGDDVRMFPGHGSETTVGEERRTNPFVGNR